MDFKERIRKSQSAATIAVVLVLFFFFNEQSIAYPETTNTTFSSRLGGRIKGFQIPEYYPALPGKKTPLRSLLKGQEAKPTGKDTVAISGLRIECYDRDGKTNTLVTTSECSYEISKKIVYSTAPLRLSRTDGSMSIQGKGFSWSHSDSILVISNQVSSDFFGLDVSGFATNNLSSSSNKVRVTSNQFTFSQKENNVQYLGNVNVSEEGTRLRCDKLQFFSAGTSTGFEQVIGEENARINVDKPDQKFSASGDQFVYVRTQNELAISGNVSWQGESQKGSANYVTLRQNGKELSAAGNVLLELDKNQLNESGMIGVPMALSNSKNTGVLTSRSDNLNSISNRITLFGKVWVQDGDASLFCDSLHIHFKEARGEVAENTEKTTSNEAQDREIEWIEATGNVKISQKDHRIETQKAVYKLADSTAIFEEHTRWSSDRLTGESDQLYMWAEPRSAQAVGNVKVVVPVEGKIQPLELFGPQAETNSVSSPLPPEDTVKTKAHELRINSPRMNVDEKQINFFDKVNVEIQSKETDFTHMTMSQLLLNFKDKKTEEPETTKYLDNIVATGKVHIIQTTSRPEPKTQQMKSETMKVQLDEKTGGVVNVVAEQDVIMEQEDVVASGKKAVFDTATQLLELTGYPVAKMPRGTLYADKMIWDRKANVFKGVSNFRIDGQKPE
jgi:lipopolysaccharide export system protein LptA